MLVHSGGLAQKLSRTEFEAGVWALIQHNFKDHDKFYVIEERRKYNPTMSEYIYEQNRGNNPHVVEVYFEGDYVCDITSKMKPKYALNAIKNGLYAQMLGKLHDQKRKEKNSGKRIITDSKG